MLRQGADNKIDLYEYAAIAQLVEQGTENPCVLGSIPSCGIFFCPYKSVVSAITIFSQTVRFHI